MSLKPLEINPIKNAARALMEFRRQNRGRSPVAWIVGYDGLLDLRMQDRNEEYLRRTTKGDLTLLGIPVVEQRDGPRDAAPLATHPAR